MSATITIKGMDYDSDIDEASDGLEVELVVAGITPMESVVGQESRKRGGTVRASRYTWLDLRVEFAPFATFDYAGNDYNTYDTYLKLVRALRYPEIWIKSTSLTRYTDDIANDDNLYASLLPIAVEVKELQLNPNFENACDELTIMFSSRDKTEL